jgi:hypothetical protein
MDKSPLLSQAPTPVEVELGCDNKLPLIASLLVHPIRPNCSSGQMKKIEPFSFRSHET